MPESYIPIKYWTDRGKEYLSQFYERGPVLYKIERQERILMQYLLLKEDTVCKGRILEVGAGFGRISRLVLERFHKQIDEYVLLDLSKDQLHNARMYLEKSLDAAVLQNVKVKYIQCDFMDFVNSDKFDLVLAVEVLMHVLPIDIQKAVNALVSLSRKDVISIDWYEDEPNKVPTKKVAAHNTLYNYPRLYTNNVLVESFKRIPIRDDNKKDFPEQSLFHATVVKKKKVLGWFIH